MTHSSNTFIHSTNSHYFTDDTVVFFGFSTDNNADEKGHQFVVACDEMGIVYRELALAQSKYWHYEKCFEISVASEDDLSAIQPIISQFGELDELVDGDATVIMLRTRKELQALYTMITELW